MRSSGTKQPVTWNRRAYAVLPRIRENISDSPTKKITQLVRLFGHTDAIYMNLFPVDNGNGLDY